MLGKKTAFLDHCTFSFFLWEKSHHGTNHHQENADHGRCAIVAQVFLAALKVASFTFCCLASLQEHGGSVVACTFGSTGFWKRFRCHWANRENHTRSSASIVGFSAINLFLTLAAGFRTFTARTWVALESSNCEKLSYFRKWSFRIGSLLIALEITRIRRHLLLIKAVWRHCTNRDITGWGYRYLTIIHTTFTRSGAVVKPLALTCLLPLKFVKRKPV